MSGLVNTVIDAAKEIAIEKFSKELLSFLVAKFPFFAIPGVNQVTLLLINLAFKYAIEKTSLGANLTIVWANNKKEVYKAVKSRDELKKKLSDKNTRKEEIKEAERKFNEAADDLIKLGTFKLRTSYDT